MNEAERMDAMLMRYLANKMDHAERDSFEVRLAQDTRLRRALAEKRGTPNERQHHPLSDDSGRAPLVQRDGNREVGAAGVTRFAIFKKVARTAAALAAIGILVLAATRGYRFYKLSPDELYAEAFMPYTLPAELHDTTIAHSSIIRFYQGKQFDSVIRRAKKQVLLSHDETLLAGVSYLVADDPFWAISPLKKLLDHPDAKVRSEAEYYLALAYLKNKDYDYALTVIQRIRRTRGHKYNARFSDDLVEKVETLKWR